MVGKIIIAVDFGTTFSAIGYTYFENGMKITDPVLNIIDKGWPGQGKRRSPKIPSIFTLDSAGTFNYGFKAANDPNRISFSKLFLDPDQLKKAEHLAKVYSVAIKYTPDDLTKSVTRFLGALREFAFENMSKKWEKSFIDSMPKEYVLSVPAMWTDTAKNKTLECAVKAGFGERGNPLSIRLVSEPEAAAVYTITRLPDCTLKTGDIFTICDAGGGTVDLTSYKITAMSPQLQVEEAATGTGDLCGSIALNARFAEFAEKRIGKLGASDMNEMQAYFNDKVKEIFDGTTREYRVLVPSHVPDNKKMQVQGGAFVMTADDVKEIFDPVISDILNLIQRHKDENKQVISDIKVPILLVGGFGSSKYLKAKIEERYPGVPVLQPPEAWSAVVRGALLRTIVRKRKIRAFYGVKFREPWTAEKHEGLAPLAEVAAENKVYDEFEQKYFCSNRMEWYVKKGDEFDEAKTVSFPFYRNVGIHHSLEFEIDLWAYTEGREGSAGPVFHDADCRRIAIMRPDLSSIPRKSLPRGDSPRGKFLTVQYELVMSFDTIIEFKLKYKDQIENRVQVDYIESEDGANLRS